ncbi:hypothetical protein BH20ACI2_BH20ACI2_19000 [soil metagenome]
MKKFVSLLAIILTLCLPSSAQSVSISSKRVTYTRPKPIVDFKKTFTINYPKVRASTPALSKKIESAISYSSILGLNLKEELNDIQWLEEADYEVNYNRNGVLTIDLRMNGTGAYPSGTSKTVVVDTRTGRKVTPSAAFRDLLGLAALVDKALKKEISSAIKEIRKDPENEEPKPEHLFADVRFTVRDLEGYAVDEKGVKFTFNYGFPHVIKALEPGGTFSFTWGELRQFIRRSGLLTRFAR